MAVSAHLWKGVGSPRLLAGSGEPFALRWSGDAQLDAVIACETVREAAGVLVGPERATRPVVRSLARSISGPGPFVYPGDNANLFPMSVLLGVDAPDGDPGRLAPDDQAAILTAGASPSGSTRRAQVAVFAREAWQRLLAGYSRRRRRDLGIEVLTDRTGAADAFLRLLDEAADLAYLEAFETPTARLAGLVEHLQWVLAHYRVPSRRMPLEGAKAWRGRSPIDLPDALVRVPWCREQLEEEGSAANFNNCLGSYYRRIHVLGVLIATVYKKDGSPLAAAEISPSGALQVLLGVADAEVDLDTRKLAVGALRQAGVLAVPDEPTLLTARERIEGRIACRAAVLLAEEIEPGADAYELILSGRQYGDRTLELLGRYSCLLTSSEYEELRAGRTPDLLRGWSHVGAMLAAAGMADPDLAPVDGRAPFRQAAKAIAREVLLGTRRLPEPRAIGDLRLLREDPTIPAWQLDAVEEVLIQHDTQGQS